MLKTEEQVHAYLLLENGQVFKGKSFGARKEVTAELVFTTGMVGYLETLSDPNFMGQMVVQTFPQIGNYGLISSDFESTMISPSAYIVKELCQAPSNFRSEGDLDTFFAQKGVVGIQGVDTRSLTKVLRNEGSMNACVTTEPNRVDLNLLKGHSNTDFIPQISVKEVEQVGMGGGKPRIAVIDFGVKNSLLNALKARGAEVLLCPQDIKRDELRNLFADGIILSDGPGDPKACLKRIEMCKEIKELKRPMLGIGLGHQLLALASGFETRKMRYGHRGANQPVKDVQTGKVYTTNQNHGFTVVSSSVDESLAHLRFENVNDNFVDGGVEGIEYKNQPALSVQFDPASCFAPSGKTPVMDQFFKMMEG